MCMCGITGWVDWKEDLSNQHVILKKMANSIEHRGPDAEGFWFSPHAAFAHRRLIVIDPEGGHSRRHSVLVIIRMLLPIMEKFIISVNLKSSFKNVGMHLKPIQIQKYYYMLI